MVNLDLIEDANLRKQLAGYTVDSGGRINSPGKFEGEPLYVPYLWAVVMDGFGTPEDSDDVNPDVDAVEIDDTDVKIFPDLAGYTHALMWESDNGFVFCDLVTR